MIGLWVLATVHSRTFTVSFPFVDTSACRGHDKVDETDFSREDPIILISLWVRMTRRPSLLYDEY